MKEKDRYIRTVLGLEIDCIPMDEVLKKVCYLVDGKESRYIVTPNSEMAVEAFRNENFRKILNKADLRIPDGTGLVWALNRKGGDGNKCRRVAGADVMLELCKLAVEKKWKVYLLGGQKLVAKKAAEKLRNKFVGLEIKGSMGFDDVNRVSKEEGYGVVKEINEFKPELLFVGFGHQKQEKWIADNLDKLKIKVAMGVGGSFDYLVKPWLRAPKMIQKMGFEWLWRLMLQPWRIKRQFGLLKFVGLVLK